MSSSPNPEHFPGTWRSHTEAVHYGIAQTSVALIVTASDIIIDGVVKLCAKSPDPKHELPCHKEAQIVDYPSIALSWFLFSHAHLELRELRADE